MKITGFLSKLLSCFLILVFISNPVYPSVVYNGQSYYGQVLEPFEYDGTMLFPISYSGSVINGTYYEGICLNYSKVTVHQITGHEQSSDFFVREVPKQYTVNWPKVIGKYAVGTTVIVITGVVTLVTGAETGFIAAASFEGAVEGALVGAATDALITGALSALKGNPKEQVFKKSIEASADGFMWGAIIGAVTGGVKGAKQLSKGTPVLDSKGKVLNLVNENNEVIIAKTGKKIEGAVALQKTEAGFPKYYKIGNKLYDFDNRLLCDGFKIKDGMLINANNPSQLFGYIDTKGVMYTEEKAIINAVRTEWKNILGKHIEGSYKFVKTGKPGSGQLLKYNYSAYYNEAIPKFAQGHHLVPSNIESDGNLCRSIFKKFGIDINDPHNCVLLPDDALRAKALNMMQHHKDIHGPNQNKLLSALSEELNRAKSKEQVFEILEDFRNAIMTNSPFWL